MELFEWMTSTTWGESLLTLLVSMVPVIELRGGVPFGTALGLAPLHALVVCIIGNMLPIPFIIVYIRRIFHWMRRRSPRLNALVDKLEKKAHLKGQKVTKYKYIGLWLFVAIPLPGTGAWTGALIAALDAMSPLKVLARGYSVVKDGDHVIKSVEQLTEGQRVRLCLSDGSALAQVEEIQKEDLSRGTVQNL